jgi:hypothetical protein
VQGLSRRFGEVLGGWPGYGLVLALLGGRPLVRRDLT